MHFDFTISLGQVVVIITLLGFFLRMDSFIRMILLEHDLLIEDYCERKGKKISELPTRRMRLGMFTRRYNG